MEISLKLNIKFKGESDTLGRKPKSIDQETQTETLPIIALETRHLDCIHGPYISEPIAPFLFIEELRIKEDEAPALLTVDPPTPGLSKVLGEEGAQTVFTIARGPLDTLGFFTNQSDKYVLLEPHEGSSVKGPVLSRAFNLDYFLTKGQLFSETIKNAYRFATKFNFYEVLNSRL
jgi:hypothetical protein